MYTAEDIVPLLQKCTNDTIGNSRTSMMVFGTVETINPLSILLDGHEKALNETFFYLSSNVKVWEEEIRIRRIHGKLGSSGDNINFDILGDLINYIITGNPITRDFHSNTKDSEDVTKELTDNTQNKLGGTETIQHVDVAAPPTIHASGPGTFTLPISENSATIDRTHEKIEETSELIKKTHEQIDFTAEHIVGSIDEQGHIDINVVEEPFYDETNRDYHRHNKTETDDHWQGKKTTDITWTNTDEEDSAFYDQTIVMEVIRNRGLKVRDYVMMISLNNQQLYYVLEVINRGPL